MRSRVALFLVLALAVQARAASVSQQQAMRAAQAWAKSGPMMGRTLDSTVSSVKTHVVTNGIVFHSVGLGDGSTVFMPGDNAIEPIVAFTSGTPSEDSPLMDILKRDIYLRTLQAMATSASGTKPSKSKQSAVASASTTRSESVARKWAALLPEEAGESTSSSDSPRVKTASKVVGESQAADVITDMRVEPLLETHWNQTTAGGYACYNYYTPIYGEGDAENYPCGCVATAIAQVMRYYKYPDSLDAVYSKACEVDGEMEQLSTLADEEGAPVPYAWDLMVADPDVSTPPESRKAIGHLTYDIGVLLGASYSEDGTGAQSEDIGRLLKNFYGYADGYSYCSYVGFDEYSDYDHQTLPTSMASLTANAQLREKVILASLDAKIPVVMGIFGYNKYNGVKVSWGGGHAVVADGYGIAKTGGEETTYVHVNLGWGGSDDAWYNLPEIDTASVGSTYAVSSGTDFEFLCDASFNITTNAAEAGLELVTGRILDDGGEVYVDATVKAYDAGGNVVKTTRPDKHGIYFFRLEGDATYEIEAVSDDGTLVGGSASSIALGRTTANAARMVSDPSGVGNVWGADVEVGSPCVRVGEKVYPNLDRAVRFAESGDTIEILLPAKLRESIVVDKSLTICATNTDAYASPVACLDGAFITVANGASVVISNIVFSSSAPVVDVLAGGKVGVAGVAVFGDAVSGTPGITTADDSGFNLAGEILNAISLDCAEAEHNGDTIGTYSCGTDVAKACANLIISTDGVDRAGAWHSELVPGAGFLKWADNSKVVEAVAVASCTVDGGDAVYYRSLDRLFEDNAATGGTLEAVVLRDNASLAGLWTLSPSSGSATWTLKTSQGDGKVALETGAGITVGANAALTCEAISLNGASAIQTVSPFTVSGNGALTFGDGFSMRGMTFGTSSKPVHGVSVSSGGLFTMTDGSEIADCTSPRGNVVYIASGATCEVEGSATVSGIYLVNSGANFTVTGRLTGSVGVNGTGSLMADGAAFGSQGSALSKGDAVASCNHIVNESAADLYAAVSGSSFVWSTTRPVPEPVDRSEAVASVKDSSGTLYYATVGDAFRAATKAGATVSLTSDVAEWDEDLEVLADGLIFDGAGFSLTRPEDGTACIAATNTSLTVKNVVVSGGATRIFDAFGGSLTLMDGTTVRDVIGSGQGFVAPVVVMNGTFTMNSGVTIESCQNSYSRTAGESLTAGAVLVNGQTAKAFLYGGTIKDCSASLAGGVYVGNEAKVEVKGDLTITGNTLLNGAACNLLVNDLSALTLVGELTGSVGYTEGVAGSGTKFGTTTLSGDAASASAAKFTHDTDNATGLVDADGKTLIWGEASDPVNPDDPAGETVSPTPIAFKSITETETGWELVITNRVPYCWYRLVYTSDLKSGFTVEGEWEQAAADATPEWTTNIVTTTPAFFWKAEAKDGKKPIGE